MKAIEIQSEDDLAKLESELVRLQANKTVAQITIRMARNLNAHFFKQSRLAALIATAAQRATLSVSDWHNEWSPNDLDMVFRSSVGNLAASLNAKHLTNAKGLPPPFGTNDVASAVANDGGILEPHAARSRELVGASLTFCSIDPDFTEPLALAGLIYDKRKFVDEFTSIKRRDLDREPTHATRELFEEESPDRQVASYVFELYQNGYEHGNRRKEDKKLLIPGLRFISIRKHVAPRLAPLQGYASGFQELEDYIVQVYEKSKNLKYYEVAVSDQGLGMLGRFLTDRPEFSSIAETRASRLGILKQLLTETLSSKKGAPGAGGGLIRALRAAKELNGFISVRTDEFWLVSSLSQSTGGTIDLVEVKAPDTAPIAGTHFNALFPLKR